MPKKVTTKELLERAKRNEERARLAREEYDKRVMEENKALIDIFLKSYEKNLGVVETRVRCKKLDIKISSDIVKGPHAFRRTRITQFVNHSEGNLIMASKLFGNSPVVAERNYYTGVDMDKTKRILESNIS